MGATCGKIQNLCLKTSQVTISKAMSRNLTQVLILKKCVQRNSILCTSYILMLVDVVVGKVPNS